MNLQRAILAFSVPPNIRFGLGGDVRQEMSAHPKFETIRRVFVKIAVRIEELNSRIKLAFPARYPRAAMLTVMVGSITTGGPVTDAAVAAGALTHEP